MDEVRTDVEQRVARYKNLMTKYHNALVKPRHFNIGDLVLKRVSFATKDPAHESWDLIGKDRTKLSIPKGEDHTTWRPWMDGSWNTLGM